MIPVSEPFIGEEEVEAVANAVRRGEISGSFGESIPRFEQEFAEYCGVKHAVAVSSGTTALQVALTAAGIGPGDEVLVSASTNIATALAALHNGAVPISVDSEPITWNLNLDLIERLITPRTRAVIPVHLYGHPVDMDRLCAIAAKHHLLVVEDCAESHGATCRGRMTGTFGAMGCFSFYANKIITTGEGGMVTTNDAELAERVRLFRNLAFTQPRFWHLHAGHNFRMTGMQAAMGRVQLKKIEDIIERKRRMAHTYNELLSGIPGLQLPMELDWARNVYWMYGVVVQPEFGMPRNEVMRRLHQEGIETRTFFCPMNQQPCIRSRPGFWDSPCPVADQLWERGLYLPSSPSLDAGSLQRICNVLRSLQSSQKAAA